MSKELTKVFVNGTFDLLHKGHLELLNYAKSIGDILYVAIDTDQRVKEKKGETRPVNNQTDRAEFLINLKSVDYVVLFSTDEELEYLVKSIEPDIMVVGSDWIGKTVIGSEHSKELKFFNRLDGYSTTNTIERIIDRGKV